VRKGVAAIAIFMVILLIGLGAWYFTSVSPTFSGTPESITIGVVPSDMSGLIYIADDRGFFTGNGLNVTYRDYGSGPSSVNGLTSNEVDVALSSEYTIDGQAFNNENISVIGCIDRFQNTYLIGWKDRGIENASDLKGKTIGLTENTISSFYIGRFLNLNGLSMQNVTLVDLPFPQNVPAFTNGSVDALVTAISSIDSIQNLSSNDTVLWSVQSDQPGYLVISCRNSWIASHPEQIDRLLKSLDQAEQYTIDHPDESKAIIQKQLNYTDAYMATSWSNNQYSLTLDQSLLTAMNDEGQWMIDNNLTTVKALPDLSSYIYTKGLEDVKPEAVDIR
jgi:NitT/TauT family transport system substrate-binding protein